MAVFICFAALWPTLAQAGTFNTLFSFGPFNFNDTNIDANVTNASGLNPVAGLVVSGNMLYGTTLAGGPGGDGTVFSITTTGADFTLLHSFTTLTNDINSDGCGPMAGLLLSSNVLYGTTDVGGLYGSGTVFAVHTDGTGFTNLYNFTGLPPDGANPQSGLILSGNTLYGTALFGGNPGAGSVFAVNIDGTGFQTVYNFSGLDDGDEPTAGLVLSGNTLYGTTTYDGSGGNGTVFAVNTDGTGFTVLHSFSMETNLSDPNGAQTNTDGGSPPGGLVLSGATLYGAASSGGVTGNGTVFSVNTNGSGFAVLHTFSAVNSNGYNSDGLSPQTGLILSGSTLYGTAAGGGTLENGTVFSLNTDGSDFTTLTSFPNFPDDGDNPRGPVVLSGTTLYGTTRLGGENQTGNIFSIALGSVQAAVPQITFEPVSQTNEAGTSVTLLVVATGSGKLTYQWYFNGAKISGATAEDLNLKNAAAANDGNYEVVVSNSSGSTTSTVATVTVLVTGNPKMTITSPTSGQSVSGSNWVFTVTGTTTDKVAVTNVSYQINGGGWVSATPSNSWSNWTAVVTLSGGSNIIGAYAQDISGVSSPIVTNKFKFFPGGTLVLKTNGNGTISPANDIGKPLGFGTNYTLTASPGNNWLFSNWVGGTSLPYTVLTNSPSYTFIMQSNLVLEANFVTNPFPAVQGSYNGLFYQTNAGSPLTEQSSGFATISIASSSKGSYSAVIKVDGGSYSFSSAFDLNGNSVTNVPRTGKSPLAVTLHINLNLNQPEDYLTGSVEAAGWDGPSGLVADLAYFNGASLKASNYAGSYALALPGSEAPAASPGGYSVAEITNNLAGNAVLKGALADSTVISSLSIPISKEGFVPVYYSYTPGTNVIFGWLSFTNDPPQTIAGGLTWFKLPTTSKGLYSSGFSVLTNDILGSTYVPATTNTLVTGGTLSIVDLAQGINLVYTNVSIISNKLTFATTTTNQLTATTTPTTGVISLSFRPTGAKANLTAQGVILQNSPTDPFIKAAGWFIGTNQSGYFLLTQ